MTGGFDAELGVLMGDGVFIRFGVNWVFLRGWRWFCGLGLAVSEPIPGFGADRGGCVASELWWRSWVFDAELGVGWVGGWVDWLFLSKLAAGLGWVRVDRGWV